MPAGIFPFLVLIMLVMLPMLFLNIMTLALAKLGIEPAWAPWVVMIMFLGSLINIPVFREPMETPIDRHPLEVWGIQRYLPQLQRQMTERIIAVNVGGFVVPMILVLYEVSRIWQLYPTAFYPLLIAVGLNILLCFLTARPVDNVGIVMPALLPGTAAAVSAMLLAPEAAPPVAFCAGVLGPVIGADLMHLGKIRRTQVGIASIGGAGTFDGIVISGLVAVLLS